MGDFVFEQDTCGLPTGAARVLAKDGLLISSKVVRHSGGVFERGVLEKGDNFPGVVLRLAHGRPDFVLEAGPAGNHHAAGGGGLQMLPRQLIRITIRRVKGANKRAATFASGYRQTP
jgi:hypothetical protein